MASATEAAPLNNKQILFQSQLADRKTHTQINKQTSKRINTLRGTCGGAHLRQLVEALCSTGRILKTYLGNHYYKKTNGQFVCLKCNTVHVHIQCSVCNVNRTNILLELHALRVTQSDYNANNYKILGIAL